jgi:poly(3-hydroxybutyrate) depolymerase
MTRPALALLFCCALISARDACAATDVHVTFTLATADPYGAPLTESRDYFLYRPDNLPKAAPVPMVLVMEGAAATFFHRKADQAGFVVVSCTFNGNSLGTVWNNDNPRITGFEDYDYVAAVIDRVAVSDNCNDAFICGLSKGGHMSYAFACERPDKLRAACSVDEFMGLTSNLPVAPVPILALHGTLDTNVPYTMGKDSIDAWRAMDGLMSATPITTYESSPLLPGRVTQTTWRGGNGGTQVAFVTIVGGTHLWPVPTVQTGYDSTDGIWAFFSQFLTSAQPAPKIVSQPVNNTQLNGQPASFWVAATGNLPLRYQWQKNGVDIAGATSNWLTIPAISPADNGATFRAIVTNALGSVTSPGATLTAVAAPTDPVVTTQPTDQRVIAGQPATFSVAATGSGALRYQWRKNGVNLIGATDGSLALPVALTADSGATLSVVVSSAGGSATSTAATLGVSPATGAPVILTSPERARVLVGQTGAFSVAAMSPAPMTYQWQKGTFTTNMVNIVGATSATYATPVTTLADHLSIFRCIVSNAAGSSTSATEMLFVTATATPPTDITSAITAYGLLGTPFKYSITSSGGTTPLTFSASPLPAGLSVDATSGAISGTPIAVGTINATITASNQTGSISRTLALAVNSLPVFTSQPTGLSVASGQSASLAVSATGFPLPTFQWQLNGNNLSGATHSILTLTDIQPANAGLYTAFAGNVAGSPISDPAILGIVTTSKVIGTGAEILSDQFVAINNNTFDQVLLEGAAEAITADFALNQITRTSFIDLNDDIVQVEFSGPGTLSLVLDNPSGPALPANYIQSVNYMKGHAGIVIVGATKDTNVSVFSVGRITAVNQSLFKNGVAYDGVADIAFIAISSTDGQFGGVRTADTNYFATKGYTGLYAPGVTFTGPVYIGNLSAFAAAIPVLVLGGATGDTWITGGDLLQGNGQPVKVSGITQLKFMAGTDSNGNVLSAKANRATFQQDGTDVTSQVVVNPGP